jgi:hypothetical protein
MHRAKFSRMESQEGNDLNRGDASGSRETGLVPDECLTR